MFAATGFDEDAVAMVHGRDSHDSDTPWDITAANWYIVANGSDELRGRGVATIRTTCSSSAFGGPTRLTLITGTRSRANHANASATESTAPPAADPQ